MRRLGWLLLLAPLVCAGEDHSDEVQARLRRWETNTPEYTISPNTPARPGVSLTARYAKDRTGLGSDPLVAEFLKRGYYLLDALHTKRDMAPLTPQEIERFQDALRTSRIEFVDHELYDDKNKRVVAVTLPEQFDPSLKHIQVYRHDWQESARLGADLTRFVFHEYMRAIAKDEINYGTSLQLTVSEREYQKTSFATASADCISGRTAPVKLSFNLAINSTYQQATTYVNGTPLNDNTSFRVTRSVPVCTAKAYVFEVSDSDYRKTLYLYGGDEMTVMIPSDREFYHP